MSHDKYYENYRSLFLTDGWKQYVEDATDALGALNLKDCKNWDSFLVTKTMIEDLEKIVHFEERMKIAEEQYELSKQELEVLSDDTL